jgi:hypothetical protein
MKSAAKQQEGKSASIFSLFKKPAFEGPFSGSGY